MKNITFLFTFDQFLYRFVRFRRTKRIVSVNPTVSADHSSGPYRGPDGMRLGRTNVSREEPITCCWCFLGYPNKPNPPPAGILLFSFPSSISDLPRCYVVDHFWLYRRFQIQLQLPGPTFEFAFVLVSRPAVFES